MTIFSIMIGFFSLSVCKSTIDFCHVITMRLICILDIYIGICVCVCVCIHIYMYMYNFKLLISRFKCILSILHLYSPPPLLLFLISYFTSDLCIPSLALFVVMLPKAHLTSHFRMSGSR